MISRGSTLELYPLNIFPVCLQRSDATTSHARKNFQYRKKKRGQEPETPLLLTPIPAYTWGVNIRAMHDRIIIITPNHTVNPSTSSWLEVVVAVGWGRGNLNFGVTPRDFYMKGKGSAGGGGRVCVCRLRRLHTTSSDPISSSRVSSNIRTFPPPQPFILRRSLESTLPVKLAKVIMKQALELQGP